MQRGARYQKQLTAWHAAKMAAQRPAVPILARGTLTYIAAESGEAVDVSLAYSANEMQSSSGACATRLL